MAKVVRFHELGGPEVLRLEEITFEGPICRSRSNTAINSRGFATPREANWSRFSFCSVTFRF